MVKDSASWFCCRGFLQAKSNRNKGQSTSLHARLCARRSRGAHERTVYVPLGSCSKAVCARGWGASGFALLRDPGGGFEDPSQVDILLVGHAPRALQRLSQVALCGMQASAGRVASGHGRSFWDAGGGECGFASACSFCSPTTRKRQCSTSIQFALASSFACSASLTSSMTAAAGQGRGVGVACFGCCGVSQG